MTETHPDLAELLRGELSNAAVIEAATHARGCETCRSDLVEVSVGHGLLSAASRVGGSRDRCDEPGQAAPDLPPQLRREVRRTRWRRPAAAAAAAVLAVSVAGGAALLAGGQDDAPEPGSSPVASVRTASLEPVDRAPGAREDRVGGRVSMTTEADLLTRMRIQTVALPRPASGQFYYVWLLDPVSNKMLPLGQMAAGNSTRFDLPESLVEAYSAIDISLEADDGDPGHSVTSVLRATYADNAPDTPPGPTQDS